MKFLVLAIDFDGTIAWNDTLDPQVRLAFAELRNHGVVIILVTGRILEDLRRVCGDLHFADAVVAENGATIEFPSSGYATVIAQPPAEELRTELRRQGIHHAAGSSVIEADAKDAHAILDAVQRLELPLALLFNRSRVMVLPQAVSKATGLKQALAILRLSAHNTLGIGDAENDHELLRSCEVGVAVAWGSEALKARADYVLPGNGPPAVATYLRKVLEGGYLPVPKHARRQLSLGYKDDGTLLSLAVRGRNVLVAGDPKSGKSWVTGLLCEQLIMLGYSLCILDPEGDYTSLEALPGVVVFGGSDPLPRPRDLVRTLRHADVSVVIDLSHTSHDEKAPYVRSVLQGLAALRRRTGLPHRIVMDEAHYFLQDPASAQSLDLELNGYTLVTYRAADLCERVLASTQAVIVTRESDPRQIAALQSLCASCAGKRTPGEWSAAFENLSVGEAIVLPVTDEAQGDVQRIRLAPRLTPHVRHLMKYIDVPIPEHRAFLFRGSPPLHLPPARTLGELVNILDAAPLAAIEVHIRRGDFSRWINDVFGDFQLGKSVSAIEERYLKDGNSDVAECLTREIRSRYELLHNGLPFSLPIESVA